MDNTDFGDIGDQFCEGDPEDVDWDKVEHIQNLIREVDSHVDAPTRDLAAVGLLADLYGDDLDVR